MEQLIQKLLENLSQGNVNFPTALVMIVLIVVVGWVLVSLIKGWVSFFR